jgi:hypothetical protein
MPLHTWPAIAFSLFVTLAAGFGAMGPSLCSAQTDDLSALDGEWLYVEDRTKGRVSEKQRPPLSAIFVQRIEEEAVVHVRPGGDEPPPRLPAAYR